MVCGILQSLGISSLLSLGYLGMQWMILEPPGCSHPGICTGIAFPKQDPATVQRKTDFPRNPVASHGSDSPPPWWSVIPRRKTNWNPTRCIYFALRSFLRQLELCGTSTSSLDLIPNLGRKVGLGGFPGDPHPKMIERCKWNPKERCVGQTEPWRSSPRLLLHPAPPSTAVIPT